MEFLCDPYYKLKKLNNNNSILLFYLYIFNKGGV